MLDPLDVSESIQNYLLESETVVESTADEITRKKLMEAIASIPLNHLLHLEKKFTASRSKSDKLDQLAQAVFKTKSPKIEEDLFNEILVRYYP